jgi:hypothetical protein
MLELDCDRCTLTYGVSPCTATGGAGEECYNTFRTCQDKANFAKGSHTYRFIGRGTPIAAGELLRPYIEREQNVPTEIDPEKGLAMRAKLSFSLRDEPDSDTEQDPYIANRAAAAGGTFWTRLLARNPNLAGRAARNKRLYIEPGDTYTLSDPDWVSESYIIDAVNGPDRSGLLQVVLKDPLKLADRVKMPAPTDGELTGDITDTALSCTVTAGEGAQYGSSGYIRIGEEVIQFTLRATDTLSWPSTAYRGKFGTTAAAHSTDDRVQLCQVWSGAAVDDVLEEMLNAAGIADGSIDLAGMATEVGIWYPTYTITVCLTEPESISKLLAEMCVILQAVMWWDPIEQKVMFKALRPLSPLSAAPPLLTDEANFIQDSLHIERQEDKRLTQVLVWYAPISATANPGEWTSYARGYVAVDPDAESANEYDDVRQKAIYARFLDETSDQAAAELAIRLLQWNRDTPVVIRAKLDPKDTDVEIGGQADVETFGLVDFDGQIERQRVLVTRRLDNGEDVEVTLLLTHLNKRWFWIAPDGHPDYNLATEEERRYGYISDDDGLLPDGSAGHLII